MPDIELKDTSRNASLARKEIRRIQDDLLKREFNLVGGFFNKSISIGGQLVYVPETVKKAYEEMMSINLRENDPVQALARYYAHFDVAILPVYNHSARHFETQAFYQANADRIGSDIFRGSEERFDQMRESYVDEVAIAKADSQKKYLKFQHQLETEKRNTNHMISCVEKISKMNLPASADLALIRATIDRMRMASTREDVCRYRDDASFMLNLIKHDSYGLDQQTREQLLIAIKELKESMINFRNHHLTLMTALEDQENKLMLSTAMKSAAIVMSSPLGQFIPSMIPVEMNVSGVVVTADEIVEKSGKKGLELAADAVHSSRQEVKESEIEVYNIGEQSKAKSVADKWSEYRGKVHGQDVESDKAREERELKLASDTVLKVTSMTVKAVAVAICPPLALPLAIYSTGEAVANLVSDYHEKSDAIDKVRIEEMRERRIHENQFQEYLRTKHADKSPKLFVEPIQQRAIEWRAKHPIKPDAVPASQKQPSNRPEQDVKNISGLNQG